MKTRNLSLYIALFMFCSCESRLDVEPTLSISDEVALKSPENVKKLLIGTYEINGDAYSYGGYLQIFSDLLGYDTYVSWNGTFSEPREALTKNMFSNNSLIQEIWNNLFRVVSQSNLVLDHLDVFADDAERSVVEGEARFLRAMNYFDLVRMFGTEVNGVPIRQTAVTDFGGILEIRRNSTAEVYAFIQDDIAKAISLLPEENGEFADKYAALALQARVNLYLGKYAEARDAANAVIEQGGNVLSPSFADAFNLDVDGAEDIFMMQVTSQSGENQLIQMYASEENGGRGGDISINQEFLDIFDDDNDERKHFYYENPAANLLSSKYTNQFGNVPIFRLAEMLLIRAETNIRLNTFIGSTPLDDVNALRQRSNAAPLPTVTLEDVLWERQRELAFEGFAIYDLKRTQSSVQGLPYNSPKLVLPIPRSEMDANPLMEQNEGY